MLRMSSLVATGTCKASHPPAYRPKMETGNYPIAHNQVSYLGNVSVAED